MYELGDYTKEGHENVGIKAVKKNIISFGQLGKMPNISLKELKMLVCPEKKYLYVLIKKNLYIT